MAIFNRTPGWGDPRELMARLRQRITIEQPNESSDGSGGSVISWTSVATVWAEVMPLRSGNVEVLFAGQMEARGTHRITIRYRNDVDTSMRIAYAGRVFNIRHISNVGEADVMLEMLTEEGGAI